MPTKIISIMIATSLNIMMNDMEIRNILIIIIVISIDLNENDEACS